MDRTTRADPAIEFIAAPPSPIRTAMQPKVASKHSKRSPLHPEDVQFSRAWLALGGLCALAGFGAIARFGWPGALAFGALGAISGAYATMIEPRWMGLTRLTLSFPDLPSELDGLRIGHLSDSHLGVPVAARNLRWAVEQMQREQPDLIAFTGDFLHRPEALQELPALLCGLEAPLGVYAVPGNHDSWEASDVLEQVLAEANMTLLMNEHRHLHWRGGELWLVGTDDVWDGMPDLERALSGVPFQGFTVLLAHTPHGAPEAAKLGVDLQLSGHTHGGHMVLPIVGPIARPRYTNGFLAGLFRVGRMTLFVSRGVAGAPLRLFCRPEAVIVTLKAGD